MPINYFISYSNHDRDLVEPIVKIVELNESFVFFDRTSIKPGDIWRDNIYEGIVKCDKMLVFWCHHAKSSKEIPKEYRAAIKLGKVIVPILLDSSRLPASLKKFQWIDFKFASNMHLDRELDKARMLSGNPFSSGRRKHVHGRTEAYKHSCSQKTALLLSSSNFSRRAIQTRCPYLTLQNTFGHQSNLQLFFSSIDHVYYFFE